jgi:hypothetical protein
MLRGRLACISGFVENLCRSIQDSIGRLALETERRCLLGGGRCSQSTRWVSRVVVLIRGEKTTDDRQCLPEVGLVMCTTLGGSVEQPRALEERPK